MLAPLPPQAMPGAPSKPLSFAFVLPYGEHTDDFFPDTLLGQLCAQVRQAGHRGEVVRAYYDGRDPAADRRLAERLERWLEEREADVVVVERLFDPAPLLAHRSRAPHRRCVMVWRGESFEAIEGVDVVVGAVPATVPGGATRRTPTFEELTDAFERLVPVLAAAGSPRSVAGVSEWDGEALRHGAPPPRGLRRPFQPVLDGDVLSLREPPRIVRRHLFGNAGCPYAADPAATPQFQGLALPEAAVLARLGCSFCCMGGDYQKRPDAEVVPWLVEQASYLLRHTPSLEELVLADQHPLPYLGALLHAASAAGVPPVRWLFAARPDTFVRERPHLERALAAARETGHALELYLSGFESFCDRELERYNKGVDVATQLEAVESMRRLAREHPGRFEYARARGHSLILWNPWTTPEDLEESVSNVRRHGLGELFNDLGRNRLRLHPDLPIFHLARRDGALVDEWEPGDEGSARRKGYNPERPWRFLDSRTRAAYVVARALRDRLGAETEVSQLAAAVAWAAAGAAGDRAAADVLSGVDALEHSLNALLGAEERRGQAPPRAASRRAAVVRLAGECNNGCGACPNRDHWLDDALDAVHRRVEAARRSGLPVVLAGREPTIHPAFARLVAIARGDDARPVGVVSNGRMFAYRGWTRAAADAGLSAASVKLFAPDAETGDRIARVAGVHEQARAGLRHLAAVGSVALEIRAPLHRDTLAALAGYARLADELGVRSIRIEVALDAVGLDRLVDAAEAVGRLADACASAGVALEASPLTAGTLLFDRLPVRPPGDR